MPRIRSLLLVMILCSGLSLVSNAGEIISGIKVEGSPPGGAESLEKLLGLQVGEALDPAVVRAGLQAVTASGQIRWIRVEKENTPSGLQIRIRVDVRPRLSRIEIEAPSLAWRLKIRRWADLQIGDPVDAARLEVITRKVETRIADAGYPKARLSLFLDYLRSDNTVGLQLVLKLGPPEVIESLRVEGLPQGLTTPEIFPKFKTGKRLRRKREIALETRLEEEMRRRGWWDAVVPKVDREQDERGFHLVFHVDPGPHYTPEIEAPAGFESHVAEVLPDPSEEDLNVSQLGSLVDRMEEKLREMGWPLAKIEASVEQTGKAERTLLLKLKPGPAARLEKITFQQAEMIPRAELLDVCGLRIGDGSRKRPLTHSVLEEARSRLKENYLRRGFHDVVIHPAELRLLPPEREGASGGKQGLELTFKIEEGLRLSVSSFDIRGLPAEAFWALDRQGYSLDPTQPWYQEKLDRIVQLWGSALADSGYPEATIRSEIRSPEASRVGITLWVDPGPFIRFGKVVIAGLSHTREKLVRRILRHAGLEEGAPYLGSTLRQTQLELYRLGLFRSVSIETIPGQEMMERRGIVVEIDEGLQRSYLLGLGWGSEEGLRATLGWSHLNLFGAGHAVSLETRYSSREFRYQLSLREAILPLFQTPGYMALYRTEETFTDYDQRREGLWLEIGDRLRKPYRHWLRYEYQVVEPDAPQEILSDLERDQQQIHLSSITPIFEWDSRNDPLNPDRGALLSTSAEWAFPAFGSESSFLKLRAGYSWYHPLSKGKISLGLRAGAIFPFSTDHETPLNLQVPLAARFFAGGSTTHRAFLRDRLGIPGETLDESGRSIGGNALCLVNAEYQHLLWKSIAGVVFVDGGNVWVRPEDVSLSEFRWGLGLGLRLDSAAGPFRLEYAHKLDRLRGESSGEFFFSFGVAF